MKIGLKIGLLLLLTVTSCKSNKSNLTKSESYLIGGAINVVNTDTETYQKFIEEENDKLLNIDSILQQYNSMEYKISNTIFRVLGNRGLYKTFNGQAVAFTKIETYRNLFVLVCPKSYDYENQTIELEFYELINGKWNLISSFQNRDIIDFYLVDLNNDGIKEIQTIGHHNMNGNYWNNFYSFSNVENKFIDGGGFFSSLYEFKPQKSRVEVEYGGSWYMPNTKTIYYWKNNKLIPYKEVEVGLNIADMKHNNYYIKYSENLTLEKDSVQQVFVKTFRGKKLKNFYDNFFENN